MRKGDKVSIPCFGKEGTILDVIPKAGFVVLVNGEKWFLGREQLVSGTIPNNTDEFERHMLNLLARQERRERCAGR